MTKQSKNTSKSSKTTKLKTKEKPLFECEFCSKKFKSETLIMKHACQLKIRWLDRESKASIVGFMAFQKFYQINYKQNKNLDDFIRSQFYNAFTKFGRHVLELRIKTPEDFIDFVLKANQKIDKWTSEVLVEEYIKQKQAHESWETGLEKTILTMQNWAARENSHWSDYFDRIGTPELVHEIRLGHISPWVLYNSKKANQALMRLNEEQVSLIEEMLDPKRWKRRMLREKEETETLKKMLEQCKI